MALSCKVNLGSLFGRDFGGTLVRSLNLTVGNPGGSVHHKAYVLHRRSDQSGLGFH